MSKLPRGSKNTKLNATPQSLAKSNLPRSTSRPNPSNLAPGVSVACSGIRRTFSANDQAAVDKLTAHLGAVDRTDVEVTLISIERWPDEFRSTTMQAIADVAASVTIEDAAGKRSASNLFEAILGCVRRYESVNEQAAIRKAAMEAIALLPPSHHADAIDRLREAYKAKQLPMPSKSELRSTVKSLTSISDVGSGANTVVDVADKFLECLKSQDVVTNDVGVPWLIRRDSTWYEYTGKIWRKVTNEDLENQIVRMLQDDPIGGISVTEPLVRNVLLNLRGKCGVIDNQHGALSGSSLWIDPEAEPTPSPFIACQNGLIDLRPVIAQQGGPELFEFTPQHFSTVQLGFDYDSNAKCPLWLRTIEQILPRKKKGDRRRERFQEFCGWTLVEHGLNMEAVAILVGDGANGKSTVLNVVEAVLGRENVAHVAIEHLNHNFRLSQLSGKLANIVNDMNRVEKFRLFRINRALARW